MRFTSAFLLIGVFLVSAGVSFYLRNIETPPDSGIALFLLFGGLFLGIYTGSQRRIV